MGNYEVHYYIRNKAGHPIATVLLMEDGTKVHRTISICSSEDNFSKKIGLTECHNRMKKLLGQGKSSEEVNFSNPRHANGVRYVYFNFGELNDRVYKCGYDVELTEFEKKLMTRP